MSKEGVLYDLTVSLPCVIDTVSFVPLLAVIVTVYVLEEDVLVLDTLVNVAEPEPLTLVLLKDP
jgi:hypothetical protein